MPEPKLSDGASRKVDPEEAINNMAQRGRQENPETFKKDLSKQKDFREYKIDAQTRMSRYESDTYEMMDRIRKTTAMGSRR